MVPTSLLWLMACIRLGLRCPLLPWWRTGCWFSNDIDSQRESRHQQLIVCKIWRLLVSSRNGSSSSVEAFGGGSSAEMVGLRKCRNITGMLQMMLVHIDAR